MDRRVEPVPIDFPPHEMPGAMDLLAQAFLNALQAPGEKSTSDILKAFYEDDRVKRIFASLSYSFKQFEHVEEARQRVAMLFFETYVPQILTNGTTPQGVYKLVFALSHNVFRSIRKEINADQNRLEQYDEVGDQSEAPTSSSMDAAMADDFLPALHRKIDMERAQNEIARRISLAAQVPLEDRGTNERFIAGITLGDEVKVTKFARRRKPPRSTEGAEELKAIKEMLGCTNSEYAEQLSIGLPTLSSYIYGRVQTVPEDVIQRARQLINDLNPTTLVRRKWLSTASMVDVYRDWAKSLHIHLLDPSEQDSRLSKLLGTNITTVWRWRQPQTTTSRAKPKLSDLIAYDALIDAQTKRKKR